MKVVALGAALESVFEADMLPCSFGFRLKRGAHEGLQVGAGGPGPVIDDVPQPRRLDGSGS